jgi:hypothetical protein
VAAGRASASAVDHGMVTTTVAGARGGSAAAAAAAPSSLCELLVSLRADLTLGQVPARALQTHANETQAVRAAAWRR